MPDIPHLLLICPRSEILGKLIGLPVALTVVHRPGGDRSLEEAVALRVIEADFTDPHALLVAARKVHGWRTVDAVLGLTELSLYPASVVGEALGARSNAPETVSRAQDKSALRQRLADCGVSATPFRVCKTIDDAREFADEHSGGTILKPVAGNGGTGVMLVRDRAEIAAAWAWASGASFGWAWHGEGESPVNTVLAEQFLTGREYSVEAMSIDGAHQVLAVTGKHTTGEPHFVETGHDVPATGPAPELSLISTAAVDALDAIGYRWGPSHTEVMLNPAGDRATVVEVNARHGGDQIWELVELTTGIDMIAGSVMTLAYGVPPASRSARYRAASIRYFTPPAGRVVGIDGLDDALATAGVIRISDLCKLGDVVQPIGDSWNRSGYLIAAGADSEAARTAAEAAQARISIRTEEDRVTAR